MSPSDSPEKPKRTQLETDEDEDYSITEWERHHPRAPRVNMNLHEGDIYTAWLTCGLCGHRQTEKVQKGQVMRSFYCYKCRRISQSRIPE